MNAYLHLDDDIASYLNEQARQEHTTLEVVLNRVVRRSVQTRLATPSAGASWLDEVRALRAKCSTGTPGTPVEDLITQMRS